VLLGPNGAGKSSLLAALTGYFAPTSGTMSVLGETFGRSDWRELRRRIGLAGPAVSAMIQPSEPALHVVVGGFDGLINLWQRPRRQRVLQARRYLRQLGVGSLAMRPWGHLSQGERQRVLIARALVASPSLLILDEPCAGLDPAAREDFLGMLQKLRRLAPHTSLILVTHHVEEIVPLFSHALLLKQGKALAAGLVRQVLTSPQLEQLFGKRLKIKQEGRSWRLVLPPRS
jgi:iron complex transport system ATP-binding protein